MRPEQGSISISILNSTDPIHPPGHRDPSIMAYLFICRLVLVPQKSPRWLRNSEVCVAVPRPRQAFGGEGEKKNLLPQVMKPLPSQGSDRYNILPVLFHLLRRSSFSFSPPHPPCWIVNSQCCIWAWFCCLLTWGPQRRCYKPGNVWNVWGRNETCETKPVCVSTMTVFGLLFCIFL